MNRLVATVFGLGHLRPGPGTWASAAALPMAWALHALGGFALLALATVAVAALGWRAVAAELSGRPEEDPSEFVVDEVVGQWIAIWPVSAGATLLGLPVTALWPGWLAAFLLFRFFDILKPGPVGWADRRHGATGVMLDDILAGVLAGLGVVLLAAFAHGVMMR